ncbi:hypothetical protein EDB81DRAFT_928170 [Dactylonectria macrodidyma]|uniref:Uncharacterized protein n=1 Tax=Dactylonectria macrodidyma TaxID=307937 RepID=A0A9P9F981_9HYPO|nr:hypothetical protein EDB81DRAFT_928170 [Dactylonectria macrodidyma]
MSKLTKSPPEKAEFYIVPNKTMMYFEIPFLQEGGTGMFAFSDESATLPWNHSVNQQPAQFQPRDDWSHWDSTHPLRIDTKCTNKKLKKLIKPVRPNKQFSLSSNGKVGIKSWIDHCISLWDLFKNLQARRSPPGPGLSSLLIILSHGITQYLETAPSEINIFDTEIYNNPEHGKEGSLELLLENAERVDCKTMMGYASKDEWKKATYNKRMYAGMIRFPKHWAAFVWDRKLGHLLVYDTLEEGRTKRLKAAGLAWREHLALAGLPYNFGLFALPVTAAPGMWESGYLGVFLLFLNLRSMVGVGHSYISTAFSGKTAKVDSAYRIGLTAFEQKHADWILDPWVEQPLRAAQELGVDRMMDFLGTVVFDELGVRDRRYTCDGILRSLAGTGMSIFYSPNLDERGAGGELYNNLGGLQMVTWPDLDVVRRTSGHCIFPAPVAFEEKTMQQRPASFVPLPWWMVEKYKDRGWEANDDKMVPKRMRTPSVEMDLDDLPQAVPTGENFSQELSVQCPATSNYVNLGNNTESGEMSIDLSEEKPLPQCEELQVTTYPSPPVTKLQEASVSFTPTEPDGNASTMQKRPTDGKVDTNMSSVGPSLTSPVGALKRGWDHLENRPLVNEREKRVRSIRLKLNSRGLVQQLLGRDN